ncbi:MAG: alpha/beta fold hydrolase [Sandaracinaceae bacterium]|nr:alpha/beta fold hydrolase [Sandaracinaceae bacterium]
MTWGEGLSTPVIDVGDGPTIVFVHGVPDSGELWTPLVAELSGRFRCIAPDLHGLGGSRVPRDFDLSLESRASWLGGLLDAVRVEGEVDIVCHDFGGPTALAWAVQNPTRVRRLVIMATCFHREWEWHSLGRLYRTPILGDVAAALQTAPVVGWTLFRKEMQRGSRALSPEFIRATFDRITSDVVTHTLRLYRATPSECFVRVGRASVRAREAAPDARAVERPRPLRAAGVRRALGILRREAAPLRRHRALDADRGRGPRARPPRRVPRGAGGWMRRRRHRRS